MGYGGKIRQWREARGWTQRQLSQQLGCTDSYVAHLEKEWKVPSHEFSRALSAALQLTPAEQQAFFEEVDATRRQRAAARRQQRGSAARGAAPAAEEDTRPQSAWRLSPDEEQQVLQAIGDPARHQAWLQSRQPLEIPFPRGGLERAPLQPVADPDVCAAYRDLRTALAHPQWRPAVLLALRAFAQAAQASATNPTPADTGDPGPPRDRGPAELEEQLIRQALEQTQGNTAQAAQLLGLSETQLRTHLTHYGLQVD
jgi:transcriptional regulator with XRE-family HTH domain